jgi:hypothetical protein
MLCYSLHKEAILRPAPQCITVRYRKSNGLSCSTGPPAISQRSEAGRGKLRSKSGRGKYDLCYDWVVKALLSSCMSVRRSFAEHVMARHGTSSRRPAKEQPPADMRDDKTAITTADHNNIPPLPALAPSMPYPVSDRCDTAGVSVPPSRRSAPDISRFHP